MSKTMLFLLVVLSLTTITTAQTDTVPLPDPQVVQISAADDLLLVGSFYILPDTQAPTVLLLHEANTSRANWTAFVPTIVEAGYNTLLVDLRGHGETGGEADWEAAVSDIQTWLDWLREQPEVQVTGISIIGADLGGNLAVIGCENDPDCLTAIAVSPVALGCADRDCSAEIESVGEATVEYLDEITVNNVTDSARRTSALLMTSPRDDMSLQSIRQIGSSRSDQVDLLVTTRGGHGTELLNTGNALASITQWLDGRTPANLTPAAIEALVAAGDPSKGETLFAENVARLPNEDGYRCKMCHYVDSEEKYYGPGLLNIGKYAADRVEGQSAAVYLYNAIVAPDSYVVDSYGGGNMPWRYDKGFTEEQIGDLVAYMLTLEE
jgi:pimeloyl-ACP methyl ester carboxylesterase